MMERPTMLRLSARARLADKLRALNPAAVLLALVIIVFFSLPIATYLSGAGR